MARKQLLDGYAVSGGSTQAAHHPKRSSFSIQVTPAGFDAIDGVVKLQASNDGVNFEDITGMTHKIKSPADGVMFIVNDSVFACETIRIDFAVGTNTTGTLDVWFNENP